MSVQNIYNLLRAAGATHLGACAIMGNMHAESTMKANIAQRGMTSLTDVAYTALADAASTEAEKNSWYRDSVGYGLCQWTYWSRKKGLLEYARLRGTSVGDETTQVLFCLKELHEEYSSLWSELCSTTDLLTATGDVCKQYERPAVNNILTRYGYAQQYTGISIVTEAAATDEPQETQQEATETEIESYWPPRTLQAGKGLSGPDVELCCALLRCRDYALPMRSEYDDVLADCVADFQAAAGLTADGIAGIKTFAALWERGKL